MGSLVGIDERGGVQGVGRHQSLGCTALLAMEELALVVDQEENGRRLGAIPIAAVQLQQVSVSRAKG